jgi:formate dehydrogenase subunit delta
VTHTTPTELRLVARIAVQFGHLPIDDAAVAVATHVRRFWPARMRIRLLDQVAADPGGVGPVLAAAIPLLR